VVSELRFTQSCHHNATHLALPVVGPDGLQEVLVGVVVVLADVVLDGLCGVPSGVVGDLARDVVGDVGLTDSVQDVLSDGAEELAVESTEGTSGKVPLLGRVVGYEARYVGQLAVKSRLVSFNPTHATKGRCAGQR